MSVQVIIILIQGDTMEAYCVKCREKVEMQDAKEVTTKNGKPMMKGKCPTCGTTVNKFLPSKKK